MVIAIYMLAKGYPFFGSFWLAMALGMNFNVFYLFLTAMPVIWNNYGHEMMLICFIFILIIQTIFAFPFIHGSTALEIELSLLDYVRINFLSASIPQETSIFWTFIYPECYNDNDCLTRYVKMAIFAIPFYKIGICQLTKDEIAIQPKSIKGTGKFRKKLRDRGIYRAENVYMVRNTIEMLVIGLFATSVLRSSAKLSYQIWFMPFLPLLIEMVGLPFPATCWIYLYLFPITDGGVDGLMMIPKPDDPMF
jgi:hypothetical protein